MKNLTAKHKIWIAASLLVVFFSTYLLAWYDLLGNSRLHWGAVLQQQGNPAAASIPELQAVYDQQFASTEFLVLFFGMVGIIGMLLMSGLLQRAYARQSKLLHQAERIRALQKIISNADLSFDEQIDQTLILGCEMLGTEIGKVGRQDPENNISEFLNTVKMVDLPVKRGTILPLDKTFCQVTFRSPQTVAISHVSESEYKNHPAAQFLGMESYIGVSINVYGKKFGTINFSKRSPVAKAFDEDDKELVNLMGGWISIMMERQIEAEKLHASKEMAENANRAKSEFLANMSHEIRTPLTAILGYSDMLRDEGQTHEEIQHEVDSINRAGVHLQRVINDILDLSKIESGQLVLEKIQVSPQDILLDAKKIFASRAQEAGLEFQSKLNFPLPKSFETDPTRLRQIIFNLCGNAVKFTEQGFIRLELSYDVDARVLQFDVVDSGIGLTEAEQEKLFKPFSQADSSITRKYGGTGLGLSISKHLAENLGGTIALSSEKGKGTCFSVKIPLNADKPVELLDQEQSGGTETEEKISTHFYGRVLLVEDNVDNQQLISKLLMKVGIDVDIAENGLQAIDKAAEADYDLVLMDIQMPKLDGISATERLRQSGFLTPIVIISANALKEQIDECLQKGADAYLAKPIEKNKFYQVLASYLKAA